MDKVIKYLSYRKLKIGLSAFIFIVLPTIVFLWIFIGGATVGESEALDPLEDGIKKTIYKNIDDYNFWYKINVTMNFLSIFASLAASVVTAATTKENVDYLKYYIIVLTVIASSSLSFLGGLRVPENVEAFIKINSELGILQQNYLIERHPFDEGLREQAKLKSENIVIPLAMLELQKKYLERYDAILKSRMRVWLNIGYKSVPTTGG